MRDTMRNLLTVLIIGLTISISLPAQELYIPNGSPIGNNTTNNNVGIGVPVPLEKLHLSGAIRGGAYGDALRISTPTGYLDIGSMNSSWTHLQTDRPKFYFNTSIEIDGTLSSHGSRNLSLGTAASTHMTLLSANGYVGIGIPTPESKLHLIDGGQSIRFLTGGNTSSYRMDVGLNDSGINFSSNSYLRSFNFTNPSQQIKFLTGSSDSFYSLSLGVNDNGVNFSNDSQIRGFNFSNANGTHVSIDQLGNVGIGTTSPQSDLDIVANNATLFVRDGRDQIGAGATLRLQSGGQVQRLKFLWNDRFVIDGGEGTQEQLTIKRNGNVGIGTTTPDAKLAVKGTVHAQEVKVDLNVPGPDYVFADNYQLPSLAEIKSYIDQHKHLPEVPSAKEMEANGVNLGEMNLLLLKKIEELTLYIIELKKEIGVQQKEIVKLKNEK